MNNSALDNAIYQFDLQGEAQTIYTQNLLLISIHASFSENYLLSVLEFSENSNLHLFFSEKPISIVALERTNISAIKFVFSVNIQAKMCLFLFN